MPWNIFFNWLLELESSSNYLPKTAMHLYIEHPYPIYQLGMILKSLSPIAPITLCIKYSFTI